MTNGKASAWILTCALALSALAGCGGSGSGAGGEPVSVEAVASLVSGGMGLADRYAGMIVAGETAKVKRDSDKVVLETYVQEGDMVKAGDPLFAYDVEKMQLDLDELYLKKADYENTVASANAEISELETQRGQAKDEDKLSYTLQIDSRRADIREAQYNMAVNDRDIAAMEAALQNTVVDSPIAGRVMSVDETGGAGGDDYYAGGEDQSGAGKGVDYITVTDVDSMRVQGNVNEMNAAALTEGMAMIIRSRLDKTDTWSGTLTGVDWENPVQNNNNENGMVYMSSDSSDEMTTASKYPFYIELDSAKGLMLGQHVYIEPDTGDDEDEEKPAGPMLPGYYIVRDDGAPYVWADDGDGKLEKRAVELGVHDENADAYEIVDGLALTDYIAFPEEGLAEGRATEKYDPAAQAEEEQDGPAQASAGF